MVINSKRGFVFKSNLALSEVLLLFQHSNCDRSDQMTFVSLRCLHWLLRLTGGNVNYHQPFTWTLRANQSEAADFFCFHWCENNCCGMHSQNRLLGVIPGDRTSDEDKHSTVHKLATCLMKLSSSKKGVGGDLNNITLLAMKTVPNKTLKGKVSTLETPAMLRLGCL